MRARLAAEHPGIELEGVLSEVVGGIRSETRKISRNYLNATAAVEAAMKNGRLGEAEVYQFARERRFEETTVALSLLCGVEIDLVERAFNDRGHEFLLILARLAGFSWTSAKAIVLLKCADRGISAQDLDSAMHSFANLQAETARRVLDFYHSRMKMPRRQGSGRGQRVITSRATASAHISAPVAPLHVRPCPTH